MAKTDSQKQHFNLLAFCSFSRLGCQRSTGRRGCRPRRVLGQASHKRKEGLEPGKRLLLACVRIDQARSPAAVGAPKTEQVGPIAGRRLFGKHGLSLAACSPESLQVGPRCYTHRWSEACWPG